MTNITKKSFLQSPQFFILSGITTPRLNDFLRLKGTFAISLSPLAILKFSFLSNLSLTFVNPLKVLCSSILPIHFIVKQYFVFGAKKTPYRIPPFL